MMYEPMAWWSSDFAAGDDWQYVLQFLEESLGGQGWTPSKDVRSKVIM